MGRHGHLHVLTGGADRTGPAVPEVPAHVGRALEIRFPAAEAVVHFQGGPVQGHLDGLLPGVQDAESPVAVLQGLEPVLQVAFFPEAEALDAERILVDRDQFAVLEDGEGLFRNVAQVVAEDERGGHHAPHREVRPLLAGRHAVGDAVHGDHVPDFQHVRIVPVAGACVFAQGGVLFDDLHHALRLPVPAALCRIGNRHRQERGADVVRGPPGVAYVRGPLPGLAGTPFADAEDHRPAGFPDCVAHQGVGALGIQVRRVAPVVFQIVHLPHRIDEGVLVFVPAATGAAVAGEVAGVAVDAELEPFGVDVGAQFLHAGGELLGILGHETVLVPLAMPSIVDIDIDVSDIGQSEADQGVGIFLDNVFIDVCHEFVPGAPAHLGRFAHAFPFRQVRRGAGTLGQGLAPEQEDG